jgi:hypothetical protein
MTPDDNSGPPPRGEWRWFGGGSPPTASDGRVVWRDAPEFLPVSASDFARVSEVDVVNRHDASVELYTRSGATCYAAAPYFAAWLDRLGIPWTDDLRKAHAAATKEGGEA